MYYITAFTGDINIMLFSVVQLAAFALLTIMGIKESSFVACFIFVVHLASMTLLTLVGRCGSSPVCGM
jgi:hypothetical protein